MDYQGLIHRAFRLTTDPASVGNLKDVEHLAALEEELKKEGTATTIIPELLERLLQAKLSIDTDACSQLGYLQQSSARLDELNRSGKMLPETKEKVASVGQLIVNYMFLALTCPELFGAMGSTVPPSEVVKVIAVDRHGPERLPVKLIILLADRAKDESEQLVAELFTPMLSQLITNLQGRNLTDLRLLDLNYITNICASKGPLVKVLVGLREFHAPTPQPMQGAGAQPPQIGRGFFLQTESLLGYVLAPTSLDNALWKEKGARHIHFNPVNLRKRATVSASIRQLRQVLTQVLDQTTAIVNPLLRSGDDVRKKVLEWFAAVLHGAEPRTKGVNQIHEGGEVNHFLESMENSPMPFHQNLDMRLQIQLMNARMQGFPLSGFSLNVVLTLFELCKPIKLGNSHTLDHCYIEHSDAKAMLRGFTEETRVDDTAEVDAAKAAMSVDMAAPKFTTVVYWLTLKAFHVAVIPSLKEHPCYLAGAGVFRSKGDTAKFDQCFGEHLCHEIYFESPAWYDGLVHFTHMTICFLLTCAYPELGKNLATAPNASQAFANIVIPPEKVEPAWSLLPSCILDDLMEMFEYYDKVIPDSGDVGEFFKRLDPELTLFFVIFLLGSGDHVKNPSLRGKATKIFMSIMKNARYRVVVDSHPAMIRNVIPSCVRVFTAVEKTQMSYYDIRMQLKYQLRAPIMELFEKMIPQPDHKAVLREFASKNSADFLKFLNQMMNDATMQLDEGLDTLAEYRRREKKKNISEEEEAETSRLEGGAAGVGVDRGVEDEDMNEGGEDMYRRSREDPKEHCRTYMKLGHRTIKTLWAMTRETPQIIVSKQIVLQQMLHNCLNSCLDRIVGPKCLELKGDTQDFEIFNFNPRELLCMIAEMYVYVVREDEERVSRMIIEDGRYYKHRTFQKATSILGREGLMRRELLDEFKEFVQKLNQLAVAQNDAMANVDIPDEFLDPIMQEIMEDPVMLPTSQTIMDRKVIERHIMSNDNDPFSRQPLKTSDLVPEVELKKKIQEFCTKHNISLGD